MAVSITFIDCVAQTLGNYQSFKAENHQLVFTSVNGCKLSLKAYSAYIVRVQAVKKGEAFFADDHYEMVASHVMNGKFEIVDKGDHFEIATGRMNGLLIRVFKSPLKLEFAAADHKITYLTDRDGIEWRGNQISTSFITDDKEHFCGMGHQAFGLVPSIDLKGQAARCNYGDFDFNDEQDGWPGQAFLTVPFYMSGKGYGLFLNSTYAHQFSFGKDGKYGFKIDTHGFAGQMDYFFIAGPRFTQILARYTQLTGCPRMPQRSIFGLQLSDKGEPDNNGANWWKAKVKAHRAAGYPLDHLVNDNRWRAGTGAWSGSWFEWDKTRYPDPKAFAAWCKANGLTVTLDLNRNNSSASAGWRSSYNVPNVAMIKNPDAVPDYSSQAVRNWVWSLFWNKSFNPKLKYPGNALWIDEVDEMANIPDTTICANGRSWAENRNYYPFLIAKAIVQQGWDNQTKGIGEAERPFVWVRAMSAGAQRYATHWSGDLKCNYDWMKQTIRGMQASGLAGFPYFNHDAGGFREPGPDDAMYLQWSLAMGSFSPIWRPHGIGVNKRWPLDRGAECQAAAMKYARLRYQMMPYIYTAAYNAYAHGLPMARAMVVDYQYHSEAWTHDLQYIWGGDMLVAPQTAAKDSTLSIWLPPGQNWYALWTDRKLTGGQVVQCDAKVGELPVFVKEGAIIPKYQYAQSTFWMDAAKLIIEIYPGKDGAYTLYEDDAVTEKYRTRNQKRFTVITYDDKNHKINIKAARGTYDCAPLSRLYQIVFHQKNRLKQASVNGGPFLKKVYADSYSNKLIVTTAKFSVDKDVVIQLY